MASPNARRPATALTANRPPNDLRAGIAEANRTPKAKRQARRDGTPHPVELLRDRYGVYGIGVSELFDFEAIAWRCGIEPEPFDSPAPPPLILRPDWFLDTKPHGSVLQKIAGGFRRGPFSRSHEEELRQFVHHEALRRAGLPWPPRHRGLDDQWWAEDKKQQAHNRSIYHGLRQLSLHVINRLIGKALEEAADAAAVKAARRFAFEYREDIYRAGALSRRALQLTETFPVLALAIYSNRWQARRYGKPLVEPCNTEINQRWGAEAAELSQRKSDAIHLVDRGARLRDVAGVMNIPMALRRIKPGVAHWTRDVLCRHPESLAFIPDTTPRQRIWLPVVSWAYEKVDAEFGEWAARHVPEIRGRTDREVGNFLSDIIDWARPEKEGRAFITRPFTPSMSFRTVTTLSAEWHEAVASKLDGPDSAFPTPWYLAAKLGDYEIIPIEDVATLYREGAAMHHCIGTYASRVQSGELCVYSVHHKAERVATLALCRHNGRTFIEQMRGPCNAEPAKAVVTPVLRWLKAQKPVKPDMEAAE
jgi:PcfJ-like protein